MEYNANSALPTPKRFPWNKGKLIGAKPPLRQKHIWAIRTKLQLEQRTRDLAMFNLAIDSKLRGCDIVALKVEDIAPTGYSVDRTTVRQKKTGRPVKFELTEQTRQAVDDYLRATGKKPDEFMFTRKRAPEQSMTTRQYGRLVSEWIADIGLDPHRVREVSTRLTVEHCQAATHDRRRVELSKRKLDVRVVSVPCRAFKLWGSGFTNHTLLQRGHV